MEESTILCPHCQAQNPAQNSYCQACGKQIVALTANTVSVAPPVSDFTAQAAKPVVSNVQAAAPQVSAPPVISAPPYQSQTFSVQPPSSMPSAPAQPPPPFQTPPQAPVQSGFTPSYPPQSLPPQAPPPVQGLPPQGYPPQMPPPQGGYPPQNYPPQGAQALPPQGYPPQIPPQNYPPQGTPPQGYPAQGPQGMPPQQPMTYYAPPRPAPVLAVPSLENFGARSEDWAELIPAQAEKAAEVGEAFVEEFKGREIPGVTLEQMEFSAGPVKKAYQVIRSPYATVAVHVGPAGKDLSVRWSLHPRREPKWMMLGFLAGIACGISFLTALTSLGNFGYFFFGWIFGTFNWLMPVAILALIAGYVWKGSLWYFFMEAPGEMAEDEMTALTMAVHQSLVAALEKAGIETDGLML